MSNSMLYHLWGARGYDHISTKYGADGTFFHIKPQKKLFVCPSCGSSHVTTRGSTERTVKTVPVGEKQVYLEIQTFVFQD
jgi:hypothetical protein